MYLMIMTQFYNSQKDYTSLSLFHPKLFSTTPIDEIDVDDPTDEALMKLESGEEP
jgi:hypothetical protein